MDSVRFTAGTRPRTGDLDELRRRRAELRETMTALERSICAPVADQPTTWIGHTRVAAGDLAAEFVDHITVTEGPGGLHQGDPGRRPAAGEPGGRADRRPPGDHRRDPNARSSTSTQRAPCPLPTLPPCVSVPPRCLHTWRAIASGART